VHLITYSQADLRAIPTRQAFADVVLEAVKATDASEVQWVCAQESHGAGRMEGKSGVHFHMAIKLNKVKRWNTIRRFIKENCGINVHFSSKHCNYYSAWVYVTKEDDSYVESPNHPDLTNQGPPRTLAASQTLVNCTHGREPGSEKESSGGDLGEEGDLRRPNKNPRHSRLSVIEVSEIAVGNGIKTSTELLALANEQKKEGKTDLEEFVLNRGPKAVTEALSTGWEMAELNKKLERSRSSRLEILAKAKEGTCPDDCNGVWFDCAQEVLESNRISHQLFAEAVTNLLKKWRSKFRNIRLVGPANSAKIFLLQTLTVIFKTFSHGSAQSSQKSSF